MSKKADFAAEGARIKDVLEHSQYAVFDAESGLHVYANNVEIVFSENIANAGPIEESIVASRLKTIATLFDALVEHSEEFRAFAHGKKFRASLDVDSGHMSFTYAWLQDGKLVMAK